MKITFLSENKTNQPPFVGEHGLSLLIETGSIKILFDAGSSDFLFQHAKEKKLDLGDVDLCVVSHGHFDHTGGDSNVCKNQPEGSGSHTQGGFLRRILYGKGCDGKRALLHPVE